MINLVVSAVIALIVSTGGFLLYQSEESAIGGLSVLLPSQGGTGIGSATAGDVGKVIKVLDDSPFTYELATDNSGGGGGGSFPFTATTNYGAQVYATNTPTIWLQGGVQASSTSHFVNASSTHQTIFGNLWLQNFPRNSILYTNSVGVVSATSSVLYSGSYVGTTTATSTLAGGLQANVLRTTLAPTFDPLTSAAIVTNAAGATAEYAGTSCTDQVLTALSALIAGTCTTLTSAYVDSSIALSATTITINGTTNQITSSAGAQSLAANRTWTLSLPSLVVFPGYASSTAFSSLDGLFVGRSATTTIYGDSATSTFSGGISSTRLNTSGTSTLAGLRIPTQGLTITTLANCNTIDTDASGNFSCGTDATAAGAADPFTWSTTYNTLSAATTSAMWLTTGSLFASSTAFFHSSITIGNNATASNFTSTSTSLVNTFPNASTTDFTIANVVKVPYETIGFTYSTTTWSGTTTIYIGPAAGDQTFDSVACQTNVGTLGLSLWDGTNRATPYIPTASTTINTNLITTTNVFTKNESRQVDIGTPASSPLKIACTFKFRYLNDN